MSVQPMTIRQHAGFMHRKKSDASQVAKLKPGNVIDAHEHKDDSNEP